MTFFDKIFKQIFPEKRAVQHRSVPLFSEKLERKNSEKSHYFKWLNESLYKSDTDAVLHAYELKKAKLESDLLVHILQTQYSNGFAITFAPPFKPAHFQHLFDFFKDKVLEVGYRMSVSDRKVFDRETYVETVEKYYLKPPIEKLEEGTLVNQKWGNVLIEHVLIDEKSSYIKLMANIYSDRVYTVALPFEGLMDAIFKR